jgi:hypothetical protein
LLLKVYDLQILLIDALPGGKQAMSTAHLAAGNMGVSSYDETPEMSNRITARLQNE